MDIFSIVSVEIQSKSVCSKFLSDLQNFYRHKMSLKQLLQLIFRHFIDRFVTFYQSVNRLIGEKLGFEIRRSDIT